MTVLAHEQLSLARAAARHSREGLEDSAVLLTVGERTHAGWSRRRAPATTHDVPEERP